MGELNRDPDKLRAWQQRSRESSSAWAQRKRARLKAKSDRRRLLDGERAEVRAEVLRRANGECAYAPIVPEVQCAFYPPDRPGLEVDELRGGAHRSIEWLNPDACRAACPAHHDYKTDHKREVLRRLAKHEGRTP